MFALRTIPCPPSEVITSKFLNIGANIAALEDQDAVTPATKPFEFA